MESYGPETLLESIYDVPPSPSVAYTPSVHSFSSINSYHISCFLAGGMSSSIRWCLTPLEVAKTRMQLTSSSSSSSISSTFRTLYHENGIRSLFRGLGPTAAAYGTQTSIKYGVYEYLKQQQQTTASSSSWTTHLLAAFIAEAIADVFMCPFETRRVQAMASSSSSTTTYSSAYPWPSLAPLWARQIPGTMANFVCFEAVSNYLVPQQGEPRTMGTTIVAGYIAGACNAIVSHPADSVLSLKAVHPQLSVMEIVREHGLLRLAVRGLGPRLVLTSNIIGLQWILYDRCKQYLLASSLYRHS